MIMARAYIVRFTKLSVLVWGSDEDAGSDIAKYAKDLFGRYPDWVERCPHLDATQHVGGPT